MKNIFNTLFFLRFNIGCLIVMTSCTTFAKAPISIHDRNQIKQSRNIPAVSTNEIFAHMNEVGNAKLTKFFFEIYQSRLFTESGKYQISSHSEQGFSILQGNQNIAFEITYLRRIKSKYLVNETIKQWQHLNIHEQDYQQYIPQISHLWPDINKGDSLLLYISQEQSVFYFNNKYLGSIKGVDFGLLFLSIWLSENTSEPELRRQLLSLNTLVDSN